MPVLQMQDKKEEGSEDVLVLLPLLHRLTHPCSFLVTQPVLHGD